MLVSSGLNLNLLRVFESVYRTRSMTDAAKELHLTQSGISQHVNALEEALEVKLFDRVKQRLLPTEAATKLYNQSSKSLHEIENVIWELKGQEKEFSGMVRIGLPIEFGNNVIMPLLAEFAQKYPLIKFHLKLDYASVMNELILNGELDFALVDAFKMDRIIQVDEVYDEVLELCIREDRMLEKGSFKNSLKYYQEFSYIEYQEGNPVLGMWFDHHLKKKRPDLNVRAYVMDVQAIARLIREGLGAGVLPGHLLVKLQADGTNIVSFKGSGKPLTNTIGIATLKNKTHSPSVTLLLEWLKKTLINKGKARHQ